jgi:hypothetical protein
MTTTPEVPMPFSPYLVSEWAGPEMTDRKVWTAYTADQLRAYADARCAKLRAELVEVMNAETQARRERDALAERVKAQRDLIRDLFAQYTTFYGVPVDQPPFIYHNPNWQELHARAIECAAIDAAGVTNADPS